MPISNAYALETIQPAEIANNAIVSSNSSVSLYSKSSVNSERLHSDSFPHSTVDFINDSPHLFIADGKERKSFQLQRSLNPEQEDFPYDINAYYSDFYDSTEQLPAVKKCENFHKRNKAYCNGTSESDIFKKFAIRRFSLNPELLRKAKASRSLALTYFSLDDMASYHRFHDSFSDWNGSIQKAVDFEENMSMSSGHFDSSSDSLSSSSSSSSSSSRDSDQPLEKSIRDYFKNRINRDSTSSLCTSQSSSYAMTPFPEEIADDFETLDMSVEDQLFNSSTLGNCKLPLHQTFLNLGSTAAEQMLVNLGFCNSSEIIPARFFSKLPKQKNKESPPTKIKADLSESKELENSNGRTEDVISKSRKDTEIDSNVEHLLMNKKKAVIKSCNRTRSLDFEEINRSTVHIINNNKPVFYKQKSIHEEIAEARRNTGSVTFENKPSEESSITHNIEKDQKDKTAPNNCKPNFEKGETDQLNEQKDTENPSHSRIPNIVVSKKPSIANIPKKSQESFEIESIFAESEQKSELEAETKIESDSMETACPEVIDNRFLNPSLFLSVSCTSSPTESPLTVIDMSLDDSKDRISRSSEDIHNKSNQSSIDLDANDTFNDMLDDQFGEVFAYNSNSRFNREQSPKLRQQSPFSSKTSSSSVEEWYSLDEQSCCSNAVPLNPYLTSGPDMVTIYKNESRVHNEDHINKKSSASSGFYTSSLNMVIKSNQKKHSDERKRLNSKTFSPLVINGIRLNVSERGFGDGEDTTEGKVLRTAVCFASDLKTEKTGFCSRKSVKKEDQDYNSKDSPIEHKEENNFCEHENGEDLNGCPEIKVSKAKIILKVSQNPWRNKISSKVILKNIDQNQTRRQNSNPGTEITKCTNNSWTQCNLDGHQRKRNSCKDNNANFPTQNLSKNHFSKNSCHQEADLLMESKERKILLNKKKSQTRASIKRNGGINANFRHFNTSAAAAAQDISTDLNQKVQFPNNSDTEKAILSLHKSSQTRIWGGLYPSCKNELNICAKCLSHKNLPCL